MKNNTSFVSKIVALFVISIVPLPYDCLATLPPRSQYHLLQNNLATELGSLALICKKSLDFADDRQTIDAFDAIVELNKKIKKETSRASTSHAPDSEKILSLYEVAIEILRSAKTRDARSIEEEDNTHDLCTANAQHHLESAIHHFTFANAQAFIQKTKKLATVQRICLKTLTMIMMHLGNYAIDSKYKNDQPEKTWLYVNEKQRDRIVLNLAALLFYWSIDEIVPNHHPEKPQRWSELLAPHLLASVFTEFLIPDEKSFERKAFGLGFDIVKNAIQVRFYLSKDSRIYPAAHALGFGMNFFTNPIKNFISGKPSINIRNFEHMKDFLKNGALATGLRDLIPGLAELITKKLPAKLNPKQRRRLIPKTIGAIAKAFKKK